MNNSSGSRGDEELRQAIRAIRTHWRRRRLAEGAPAIVGALIVALLLGVAFRSALASPAMIVLVTRVVGYSLIALATAWFVVRPAIRRVSDTQLALYVEETHPELRQILLSAVDQLHRGIEDGTSAALGQQVMVQAAVLVRDLEDGAAIERPHLRRAAVRFGAMMAAAVLLVAFGPVVVRDMARVLFTPWSHAAAEAVPILSVAPGNVSVPRGGALDIRAGVRALADHGAVIMMRPDSATEWSQVPMIRDSTGRGYVARLFDINRSAAYYVVAGGMHSPDYRITVTDLPTVQQLTLELHYPAYTGRPPEKIDNGGDVAAVTGTNAVLTITATLPVKGGALHFDDGTDVPLALDAEGHLDGSFKIVHDGFYRVDMIAVDGTQVPGSVQHSIEALVDHPPTIRIEKPGRDTRVTSTDEVPISIHASDDYGVRDVELHYSVNGGADHVVAVSDSAHHDALEFSAVHTLFLEEMALRVGDLVAYHATVRDGAGNRASSDIYFMEVRPFDVNYRSADDNGGGGGGGGGNNPGKLTERQRQLIAGTFNWQRDSARTADRDRRANATTLAIGQGKLRADVIEQVATMIARQVAATDTAFVTVEAELDSAATAMKPAEDGLGRHVMRDAIPSQEQALQHLQAADDVYRDITVRQQQGGGGGGGGAGGEAQDLADLFELQTDKLKNQYETPRGESSTPTQQAIDSTQEKLKELAARQQEENEREQHLREQMQQRQGPQQDGGGGGGGGGGQGGQGQQQSRSGQQQPGAQQTSRSSQQLARSGSGGATGSSQRDLARQTEDAARQLEKLSREQDSPEMADAAERLQQAADAMRQAAAGSAEQGSAAVDRLRDATRNLQSAAAASQQNDIKDLAQRAAGLEQQQQEIAHDVAGLGNQSSDGQAKSTEAISQRKDALANAVRNLGADADRIAAQSRRDQPKAAAAAQGAADEIRDRRLPDLINYSKNVIRAGSPEYARQYESEIGESLDSVAHRLATAAGSVGVPSGQEQALAVARTSDLVRDLESLRDRTAPDSDANGEGVNGAAPQGRGSQSAQGARGASQRGRGLAPGDQGRLGQGQGQQSEQGRSGRGQGEAQQGDDQRGQSGSQGQGQTGGGGQGAQQGGQRGQSKGQGQAEGRGQAQSGGQGQAGLGQGQAPNGNGRGNPGDNVGGQARNGGGPATGRAAGSAIGDPRQFRSEVAVRRQAAESLRGDLHKQGVDVTELDHALDQLGELQAATDPGKISDLQAAIVAELKDFEYNVWRKLDGDGVGRAALGSAAQVPPQYRGMVEEYYRALARKGPK